MAHPRKKRKTQQPSAPQNVTAAGISKTNPADRTPKSMVIRMGASDVGPSITQLVKDMRVVMEPHTAVRLKERRSNRLRDYSTMAGPLGVTHLLLFSRSASGNTNLRIAITPRGPTWSFRVEKYSLCKDVAKAQRHPKTRGSGGTQHLTPPLLVMNNFTKSNTTSNDASIPKHLESLTTSVFQSLFPPISPQRTPLSSIRRVLLLNRESPSAPAVSNTGENPPSSAYILSLRHYAITTKPVVSLSRGLKRIRAAEQHGAIRKSKPQSDNDLGRRGKGALPNLSRLNDVADYLLDPASAGFTSASESEVDTDAEVEVMEADARKVFSRRDKQRQRDAKDAVAGASAAKGENPGKLDRVAQKSRVQKRAVRLTEIGPRMRLRLVKVEEGLCDGKVMWHEFITKSETEQVDLEHKWETRRIEKEERRRTQKENLDKKKKIKGDKSTDHGAEEDGDTRELDGDLEDEDWDEYDDAEDAEMGEDIAPENE